MEATPGNLFIEMLCALAFVSALFAVSFMLGGWRSDYVYEDPNWIRNWNRRHQTKDEPATAVPAATGDARQKRKALSDERYRLAVAVRNEWLKFEGLNNRDYETREQRGDFTLAELYLGSAEQAATLILLYGFGHRPPLNHAAAGTVLGRGGPDMRRLEREAVQRIEGFLWHRSNPGKPYMRFSKTYKIWLTTHEWEMAGYWKQDGKPLFVDRQPENPHPRGISPTNENARQWLLGEAHMVWLRKQTWAVEHLPAVSRARSVGKSSCGSFGAGEVQSMSTH